MPKLPNAERARVSIEKLRDYSLDSGHETGKHKARVFAAALRFTTADAELLRKLILDAVLTHDAEEGKGDEHGARYTVDFELRESGGAVTIRTAWIIDAGEDVPRLVSCYVRKR